MTENDIMQYNTLVARVERNKAKIADIKDKDIPLVTGKVKGSSSNFPYIETHYSVQMHEPKENYKCCKRIKELKRLIENDQGKIKEIEELIMNIDDPELQLIFEMRVLDKKKWNDIAAELEEDKSRTTYSRKFKNYLQNAQNAPIAPIAQ